MPGPIPKAVPVIRRLVRQSEQAQAPVSGGGSILTAVAPHTIGGPSHTAVGAGWRPVLTADLPGVLAPATLSRLWVTNASDYLAVGDGSWVDAPFDSVIESVGSDIAVDGGDDTIVRLVTAGLYALVGRWYSFADVPADVTLGAVAMSGYGYIEAQPDAGYGTFAQVISFTRYFIANSPVGLGGTIEGSTWNLGAGSAELLIQRIA